MTDWTALNSRGRAAGLAPATPRQGPAGLRYTFVHEAERIDDPSLDPTGQHPVSPREYGFSIRGFEGGRTAWARDFSNGTLLVVHADGQSHMLSTRASARILFIDPDGVVLQDTGSTRPAAQRTPELATVRLTLTATVDLNGASTDAARALLLRMVDRAVMEGALPGESEITVVEHALEASAALAGDASGASDTDFSQLLDL